jgi:hypothetical protein
VRSLEHPVVARSVVGSARVVAAGVAAPARASAAQRRSRRSGVASASSWRSGFGVARFAHAPFCSGGKVAARATVQAEHVGAKPASLARAESPRERGQLQLGAERAAHENEYMSQCLVACSAAAGKAGASRRGQEYKSVPRALPNPSIERTNNGGWPCAAPAAVCAPLFAAHVER